MSRRRLSNERITQVAQLAQVARRGARRPVSSLASSYALAALLIVGCSSSSPASSPSKDGGTASAGGTGTVTLHFSIVNKKEPALTDPPIGTVYGAIYLAEDVTLTGPREGAKEYASVEFKDVDLRTADLSATSWKSPALEPNKYIFTGFFDVDANGATSRRPDKGDPVTLPTKSKQFDVVAGSDTPFTIGFDLIFTE